MYTTHYRFDFSGRTPLPFENTSILTAEMLNSGSVDAIFMWWDLEMDDEGEIILSCAPRWAHPTPGDMQVCIKAFTPEFLEWTFPFLNF